MLLGGAARWGTSGGSASLSAPLSLPDGARIVVFELDYIDTSISGWVYGTLIQCDYLAQNCVNYPTAAVGPLDCAAPGYVCSGSLAAGGPGFVDADLTGDNVVVDNVNHSLRLSARTNDFSGGTKLAGMIVGYVLQVSPAPATPPFNDVPPGDFGFQYIEALVKSGITVGCQASPRLYCPDAPLTRRQMAIFLAKALGLQFPWAQRAVRPGASKEREFRSRTAWRRRPPRRPETALDTIQTYLELRDISSRDRFGCWKYEIGNQDHSLMQGVDSWIGGSTGPRQGVSDVK